MILSEWGEKKWEQQLYICVDVLLQKAWGDKPIVLDVHVCDEHREKVGLSLEELADRLRDVVLSVNKRSRKMQEWEYLCVDIGTREAEGRTELLNELAVEGWELVCAGGVWWAYLRRPLVGNSELIKATELFVPADAMHG